MRDVLKYHFDKGYSQRRIATVSRISRKAVSRIIQTHYDLDLGWPIPSDLTDQVLDEKFNPHRSANKAASNPIDYIYIDEEMRKPGATLATLHNEWQEGNPDDHQYDYSTFCKKYRLWKKSQKLSMRSESRYGEAAYVDYSGVRVEVTDAQTGEVRKAEIFVGVLSGSQYAFVEATWTQRLIDFLSSHVNMFEFFEGVPQCVVPDNLKSAVTRTIRHDPVINESYLQMCRHYGTAPWPARPGKPRTSPMWR
uniref:IS21 family transposase n=1 Tax=Herbaspirillum huttiense subsp. nephrolepidis TaxID=3075126 RepID=A0AAE4GB58_9BURK